MWGRDKGGGGEGREARVCFGIERLKNECLVSKKLRVLMDGWMGRFIVTKKNMHIGIFYIGDIFLGFFLPLHDNVTMWHAMVLFHSN